MKSNIDTQTVNGTPIFRKSPLFLIIKVTTDVIKTFITGIKDGFWRHVDIGELSSSLTYLT